MREGMNPELLEVYCRNERCSDLGADTGAVASTAQPRKPRRMDYKGKRRIGIGRAFLSGLIMFQFDPGLHSLPAGRYHIFQCAACDHERIYREQGELLTEV